MKFNDFEYKRPDMQDMTSRFEKLLNEFESSVSFEKQNEVMIRINELRSEFSTMSTLASIRHSVNTLDPLYEAEQIFFDENSPVIESYITRYYSAIIKSKFRKELEEKWGRQLFAFAETMIKTFRPEILEDLKKENELRTEYNKLLASAKIIFKGEEHNLQSIGKFQESTDREERKESSNAKWNFFSDNAEQFDRIYDELVKLRHSMATKLGYKNFIEMGYARMGRTDYGPEQVAEFRRQVLDYIVPIVSGLTEKQKNRLGVDKLTVYDLALDHKDGNAKPSGEPEWIVDCARNMYSELSKETNEFFDYMINNDLMDLVNKKGKETGGYCTYIEKYKSPFIFSNFNGTMGDVEVLTHEAGHAFQVFSSRSFDIPEYHFPTSEACEIHSMSMEFLTWPWMTCFFKEETNKFYYSHLKGSMEFLPYGVTVDEFQHAVYENPDMTPAERNQKWLEIEKKYLPHMNYDGIEFLEQGGRWQQQRHIYGMPFYYIDYCLAQICAFQFWKRSQDEDKNAFSDYLTLCKAGGSKSFLELVKVAKLRSPFEPDCIKSFIDDIDKWLNDFEKVNLN
jgi:M3 family oligoendopeptidase